MSGWENEHGFILNSQPPAEIAKAGSRGEAGPAPVVPGVPHSGGPLLSRTEALFRLEELWASEHAILWLDWDLGRADRKEAARRWVLDNFLVKMGIVPPSSDSQP